MKKSFAPYLIGWLAALGLFNLIAFIVPSVNKYDTLFWISYSLITLAFIGNLGCAYYVAASKGKRFYNIPILHACVGALVALLIVGAVFGLIPVPLWIGVIICFAILALNIIAVAKAVFVANTVSHVDEQVKTQTFFIKALTVDAQTLMNKTAGTDMAVLTGKVYETVRYSDPMSNPALSNLEGRIFQEFSGFSAAVDSGNAAAAQEQLVQLIALLEERNQKCKLLK